MIGDVQVVMRGGSVTGPFAHGLLLGAGVAVLGSASADLQGNTITRSPVGVHLEGDAGAQGSDDVFTEVGEQVRDVR